MRFSGQEEPANSLEDTNNSQQTKKTKTKEANRAKDIKYTRQSVLSAALWALWAEITNKWVFYFQQSKLEIPLFIFHQHYGEVQRTIDPSSTNLPLSPSLIASTETGRKSSSATTTRWAWRSTLATRGREGRTRPSCTWCCPPRPTTAESPAITRWRETARLSSVCRQPVSVSL